MAFPGVFSPINPIMLKRSGGGDMPTLVPSNSIGMCVSEAIFLAVASQFDVKSELVIVFVVTTYVLGGPTLED